MDTVGLAWSYNLKRKPSLISLTGKDRKLAGIHNPQESGYKATWTLCTNVPCRDEIRSTGSRGHLDEP